jgi:rubrerythrin
MPGEFDTAEEGLRQMGASVRERELVEMLVQHGEKEGELLARYERYASQATSPAVRYLVNLILEDERRHHRLLEELANTIAWGWSDNSPGPATPEMYPRLEDSQALRRETRALLNFEEADRKELRRLRRELRAYEDTTLWALIVDILILDTNKHKEILRFIAKCLR